MQTARRSQSFLRPQVRASSLSRAAWLAAGFALLIAIGAQVRVPLPGTDVPMTLQPVAVLLAGLMLTPGTAVSAMVLYLAAGSLGAPVFAAGSGGVLGATGGYLVGFVAAAWVVSKLRGGPAAGFVRLSAAAATGLLCILTLGVLWRTAFFGGNFGLAFSTGFLPFVIKAGVEILLSASIASRVRRLRRFE